MGTSPYGRRAGTLSDFHPQQAMEDSRCVLFNSAALHLEFLDHLSPLLRDLGWLASGVLASTASRQIKRRFSGAPRTADVRLPNPGAIPDWFWTFWTRWRVGWYEHRVAVEKANQRWERVRKTLRHQSNIQQHASKPNDRSLSGPFVVQADRPESG